MRTSVPGVSPRVTSPDGFTARRLTAVGTGCMAALLRTPAPKGDVGEACRLSRDGWARSCLRVAAPA